MLEEREKELESSEQAVRNGTDSEYEKNVRIIESTRENARNAAKRRFEMLKSNVESQFDCSLRQHKREFVQRRADLRRQMQKMAVKISLSLQEEFKDMEKTRLGVRIRMMEHLWRRSSPSVLPQTSEVPVDSESLSQLPNTTPVAPVSASRSIPVVQQVSKCVK